MFNQVGLANGVFVRRVFKGPWPIKHDFLFVLKQLLATKQMNVFLGPGVKSTYSVLPELAYFENDQRELCPTLTI